MAVRLWSRLRSFGGINALRGLAANRGAGRILLRYGLAVWVSTLPVLIKLLLDWRGIGDDVRFLLLVPAVLISAWYGGLGPGLLATALTCIGADLFFLPPYGVVTKTLNAIVALTVYVIEGVAATWLTVLLRRSQEERVRLAGEERVARAELEAANRIRTWILTSPMPIISLDPEGNVTRWNPAAERLFGWAEEEMTPRGCPRRLRDALPEEWKQIDDLLDQTARGESLLELDTRLPTKDGSWRDVRISAAPIHNAEGWTCGMMAVLTDVTERRQMERQLHFQALHDALTGLPNRKFLYDRLGQSLLETSRSRSTLALLVMDLDGFKEVNDTFGHHYGDLLLQDVTVRLQDALDQALVARLGGDEFAAVLLEVDGDKAVGFAEKIHLALSEPFSLAGQKLTVGTSVGVAVYPMDGTDTNTLLQHADAAMYVAKRRRCGYALYSSLRRSGREGFELTARQPDDTQRVPGLESTDVLPTAG